MKQNKRCNHPKQIISVRIKYIIRLRVTYHLFVENRNGKAEALPFR